MLYMLLIYHEYENIVKIVQKNQTTLHKESVFHNLQIFLQLKSARKIDTFILW